MFFSIIILLFLITVIAGLYAFGVFSAPAFAGATILFYFLLAIFIFALIVAIGQQYGFYAKYTSPQKIEQGP
jgi:hypothetical protein